MNKSKRGITLIALVITIIVLLILAGISISMLSGNNSILDQANKAKTKNIHANVLEQMQLEASSYTVDKTTGNYSNSLIDYLKGKSIISDISGEEDKWLINVTTLLGANQSMGIGTYPNDVYVLEKQDTSTGSIVNTKVASIAPIKVATTSTSQITYKVVYYENTESENLPIGSIFSETNMENGNGDYDKIYAYLYGKSMNDVAPWDDNLGTNVWQDDTVAGILGSEISELGYKANSNETGSYVFIEYNNHIYVFEYDLGTQKVTGIESINVDKNRPGEYGTGEKKVLVIADGSVQAMYSTLSEYNEDVGSHIYCLKNNGDLDLSGGYVTYDKDENIDEIYDSFGQPANYEETDGLITFTGAYYLKENGEIDYERPLTSGYISQSSDPETGKYRVYNASGVRVNAFIPPV